MSSLQFTIPRSVANAVDFPALRARTGGMIEYNDKDAGPSKTRITCQASMAAELIDAIQAVAKSAMAQHDSQLVVSCGMATASVVDAIAAAKTSGDGNSPAKGIGRAMGD